MTMDKKAIRGTRTEQNLLKAFAGESQARSRYTIFAEVAKAEGYEQIAAIFAETAENEYVHARRFFSFLDEGNLEITATYPAGPVGDTARNLAEAANGEHEEWADMYPEFSRIAAEEGFNDVAALFKVVARVEQGHEERYRRLYERVTKGEVFHEEQPVEWQCRKCGYIHNGKDAPRRCPACLEEQAYFERKPQNF